MNRAQTTSEYNILEYNYQVFLNIFFVNYQNLYLFDIKI